MLKAGSALACLPSTSVSSFSASGPRPCIEYTRARLILAGVKSGYFFTSSANFASAPAISIIASLYKPSRLPTSSVSPCASRTLSNADAARAGSPVASAAKNSASPTAGSFGASFKVCSRSPTAASTSPIPMRTEARRVCNPTSFGAIVSAFWKLCTASVGRLVAAYARPSRSKVSASPFPVSATLAKVSTTRSGRRLANWIRASTL